MDSEFATKVARLAREDGFADVDLQTTENSVVVRATKRDLFVFFELTRGTRGTGPATAVVWPDIALPAPAREELFPGVRLDLAASAIHAADDSH
jgi:hypothetical protein